MENVRTPSNELIDYVDMIADTFGINFPTGSPDFTEEAYEAFCAQYAEDFENYVHDMETAFEDNFHDEQYWN